LALGSHGARVLVNGRGGTKIGGHGDSRQAAPDEHRRALAQAA
jgi:hypothetical protein